MRILRRREHTHMQRRGADGLLDSSRFDLPVVNARGEEMESTQVVIIGGGATGAGILWDLSLRGISATLLEQGDIANGATGRCHGLLHSGGHEFNGATRQP